MAEKATKAKDKAPIASAKAGRPVKSDNPDRYRLKKRYKAEIVPQLMKERGYKNINQVPKIEKIVLNMRLGDIKDNSKSIQLAQAELDAISGQRSVLVKAKKSVSNFKLREGQSIAIKVTLRGEMAYEFLDRLVSIALPRVRDFRGISGKSFDGRGNYALGIKDQTIFPEISYELIEKIRGFDVDIVTTAATDEEAKVLLTKLGMPFKN
ncbi:MAG: 50S ribosomal protein L5 [Clostridiales bacterium]|nr:50S ribosomal protein L5 [Clostridiales bacterium]